MHDLAPLRLAALAVTDWEWAAIPGTVRADIAALHVKTVLDRAPSLQTSLGFAHACRSVLIGQVECLWMGPCEWLLLSPPGIVEQLTALGRQAIDQGAAVADAQDRFMIVTFALEGSQLAALTGLADESIRAGCVVRTRLADVPVMIVAGRDALFRVFLDRTHAQHFRLWLDRAI